MLENDSSESRQKCEKASRGGSQPFENKQKHFRDSKFRVGLSLTSTNQTMHDSHHFGTEIAFSRSLYAKRTSLSTCAFATCFRILGIKRKGSFSVLLVLSSHASSNQTKAPETSEFENSLIPMNFELWYRQTVWITSTFPLFARTLDDQTAALIILYSIVNTEVQKPMASTSPSPSPQEVDGNNTSDLVVENPELGEGDSQEPRQDPLLIRQGSDASSSSSSTSASVEDNVASYVKILVGSTANLCSATLGAGILALPYAFHQAGIICGLLLLLVSAWATFSSIDLLAETFDQHNLSTYEKAVEKGLGRRFRSVVEISILVFCCGTAVGYVKAVGDIMERVVPYMTKAHEQMAMCAVWLVAMLPLSCLRRMKSLECASSVGIMSIGTLLVAAIVHLVKGSGHDYQVDNTYSLYGLDDDYEDEFLRIERYDAERPSIMSLLGPAGGSWLSVLQACPIFFYAFSSQVNVAQIFEELPGEHGNNPQKIKTMKHVTFLGVFVCGLLYASLSLVTLVDFGDRIQPNVLSCYSLSSKGQPLLHVAFLGMALAVVIAFPLNIFPARVSLIQMWEEKQNSIGVLGEEQMPDAEGINQPLLSKESRAANSGYDSAGEADGNDGAEEDPLRSPTPIAILRNDSILGEEQEEFHCAQHTSLTLLLAGMALGCALVVPNISVVFGLLGGTTSSLLGFVVPGLLGLEMDKTRVSAWVLVIFGSLIGVMTTGATIHSMVHS